MDIDYKLEREMMDLREQGTDDQNPKSLKIKKRLALLQKLKQNGSKKDKLELFINSPSSSGSSDHKEQDN